MATKVKKWKKEDHILALYYAKCGIKGLGARTEFDFAEGVIGCSLTSLKKSASNFRFLMGNESEFSDVKKLQKVVYDELKNISETDLRNKALEIIGEKSEEINEYYQIKKEKEDKKKFEDDAQKLVDIFRAMGKDPSKMRRLEKNPVE